MERIYKRTDGPAHKELPDAERYERRAAAALPASTKSPHGYSPPVYSQQSTESVPETDGHQTSSSPFHSSYSPSSSLSFYPRFSSSSSPTPTHASDCRQPASSSSFLSEAAAASGPRPQAQTHTDSRGAQQQTSLSPGQGGLQACSRLPGASHYSPHQAAGVRTQSGSF